MTMRRSDWLWLGGILALALVLRAVKLDAGLWYDEIVTLVESVRLPTRELLVSLAGILASLLLLPANYRNPKQDFVGARNFIESSRSAGDRVASVGLTSVAFSSYYSPEWEVLETRDQLDRLRGSGRTWVVFAFPGHTALNYPNIMDTIASDFHHMKTFPGTLGNGDVLVYRRRQ